MIHDSSRYIPGDNITDSEVKKLFGVWNKEFLKRQKELDENQE
jgi:hypothetical protein